MSLRKNLKEDKEKSKNFHTICPKSLDSFYIVKLGKTSWTYSMNGDASTDIPTDLVDRLEQALALLDNAFKLGYVTLKVVYCMSKKS